MTSTSIYSASIPVTQSKICRTCKELKSIEYYSKNKKAKDGVQRQCKLCSAVAHKGYKRDKEKVKEYLRTHIRVTSKARREREKEYRYAHKAEHAAKSAKRRATKLSATPKWAELYLIKQLYIECKMLSESSGIKQNVDHIVPLQSEIVCGLHCIANMRIINEIENKSKSNSYWPDMW